MSDVLQEASEDMTARFTRELSEFMRERLPTTLSDAEFAAASSGMMIALNRQLATCAAAFGETHQVNPQALKKIVKAQFDNNLARALDTLRRGTLQ